MRGRNFIHKKFGIDLNFLREPLYVQTKDLCMCQGLFKDNYWPFIDTMRVPVTLNDFRHYFAAVSPEREQYRDLDIDTADTVCHLFE